MRKLRSAILLLVMSSLLMTGCTNRTHYGECIGINDPQVPGVTYKVSTRNVILGIVFIETIVVPVIVVLDDFKCPIAAAPHA